MMRKNVALFLEQRNRFRVGDQIEILLPQGDYISQTIREIYNEEGSRLMSLLMPIDSLSSQIRRASRNVDSQRKCNEH